MMVNPTVRVSGISVEGDNLGACRVTNAFRRRSYLYASPMSFQPEGGAEQGVALNLTRYEISPTAGVTSIVGTLADLFAGNQLYTPQTTDIPTPLNPANALRTTYRLWAVGPGVQLGELLNVPGPVADGWREVIFRALLFDFVLPFLTNVLVPIKSDQLEEMLQRFDVGDVLKDVFSALSATDSLYQKLREGRFAEACTDAVSQILNTDSLQMAVLTAFGAILESLTGQDRRNFIAESWRAIDGLLDLGDLGFTLFDSAVQSLDIASSRLAETWEILVTKPKVTLTPANADASPGDTVTFTADLVDEDTGGQTLFTYRWRATGTTGTLKGNSGQTSTGNWFDSSQPTATFEVRNNAAHDATEDIEVEIYRGGVNAPNRAKVGGATAKLKIADLNITGKWIIPGYHIPLEYNFVESGGVITGNQTIFSPAEVNPVNGQRNGRQIQASYPVQFQGNTVTIFMTQVSRDRMEGYATNSDGFRENGVVLTRVAAGSRAAPTTPTRRAKPGTGVLVGGPPVEWL